MKKFDIAVLALLLGSSVAVSSSATGAALSPGLRAIAADRGVILISDCYVDDYGNEVCAPPQQQYEEPQQQYKPKKPSKTQQFLEELNKAVEEQNRQNAIKAQQERERQQAVKAKKERERQAIKAQKERERQQAIDAQKAKAAKAAADKAAADKAKADAANAAPVCKTEACPAGQYQNANCRCVGDGRASSEGPGDGSTTEVTILNGKPVDVVVGPSGDFPAPPTLPDPVCQLKIGNTTIYCDGYLPDLPPTRNSCTGRTERGCYLRIVNVPKVNGETAPACMQFCNKKRPPVITKSKPTPPKDEYPVVAKTPGAPAVPTGTATVYREPPRPQTPAVNTAKATTYVEPRFPPTPAVKTAIAATYVEPRLQPTPAVNTVIAAPVVEPSVKR